MSLSYHQHLKNIIKHQIIIFTTINFEDLVWDLYKNNKLDNEITIIYKIFDFNCYNLKKKLKMNYNDSI